MDHPDDLGLWERKEKEAFLVWKEHLECQGEMDWRDLQERSEIRETRETLVCLALGLRVPRELLEIRERRVFLGCLAKTDLKGTQDKWVHQEGKESRAIMGFQA